MFTAIAIHHPHPDHVGDLVAHMRLVVETTSGAEGLVEFSCWREADGRLIGYSRWESHEAFQAALPLIGANVARRRPEWTTEDDELLQLDEI
jgi:quinol monooxygenase YgiN